MSKRIKLVQTCGACPEQYDAYIEGESSPSGYLRLRHGYFRAEYQGKVVFDCHPNGDGCFEYDERDRYLNQACAAILAAHDNVPTDDELIYEIEPMRYDEE